MTMPIKKTPKRSGKKADKKKQDAKPLVFELDNRRHRMERLTGSSSKLGAYYVSPKRR